jgi:uncharacterized membrane protein YdjX (TVP38/TMEM64 family)
MSAAAADNAARSPHRNAQVPIAGHMSAAADPNPPCPPVARFRPARLVPLGIIAFVSLNLIVLLWYYGLSPVALLERRVAIDAFVAEHRIAALGAFMAIYALAVALSLPGAVLLTICGGIVFGGFAGGLAALVGATIGATMIFLVAKTALGDFLTRRAGRRAEKLTSGFCADAFSYLLFLRLVPVFPFWLVNLVPALCNVRLTTFVAATALGIVPGTFAFAYFGAGLDSAVMAQVAAYRACMAAGRAGCRIELDPSAAVTTELIAGLVALSVLSLIPVAVKRFKAARTRSEPSPS